MSEKDKNYVDYRSFLMANVDTILQTASTLRQSSTIESEDLFGGGPEEKITEFNWQKQPSNLSIFQVLLKEKDSLGLFISGNPLNEYAHVQEWVRNTAGRDDIFLVLITKIRKIFTKAGQMMLALEITLNSGEVEGVIFPKKALDLSPKIAESEMFWVRGKISLSKKREQKLEILPAVSEDPDTADGSDEMVVTERVEQVKEYDELPKLLIDNLAIFEDGPLGALADEDVKISINREKILKSKDWLKIKQDPANLSLEVDTNSSNSNASVSEPQKQSSNKLKVIKVTKEMGAKVLNELKESLKKEPNFGLVEIELWVENQGQLRKVKGNYWILEEIANRF